jgi:hypothetical protein
MRPNLAGLCRIAVRRIANDPSLTPFEALVAAVPVIYEGRRFRTRTPRGIARNALLQPRVRGYFRHAYENLGLPLDEALLWEIPDA